MNCEKCGEKLNVVTTKCSDNEKIAMPYRFSFIKGSLTYRLLKCSGCKAKVKTVEITETELKSICEAKLTMDKIKNTLRESD